MLPATDLFLMGREHTHNVPRGIAPAHRLHQHGVTCSLATNNVLNPFTPFGDCSLLRMANLFANAAHIGADELATCFDMVTALPAKLMKLADYGIEVGHPADIVVLDCHDRAAAVAELAQPCSASRTRPPFVHPRRAGAARAGFTRAWARALRNGDGSQCSTWLRLKSSKTYVVLAAARTVANLRVVTRGPGSASVVDATDPK